ncbi:hypothetical protein K456DRAFT_1731176 [Colletotrichum gloeosporioides 23]|nr:hypothetical protein K456DRAFT_1731176 [Colletotrichum gloeosporioides 23]
MANIVAKYGIMDSDIYNFDETGFIMGQIASSGYSVPLYIIIAGQYHLSTWYMEIGLLRD